LQLFANADVIGVALGDKYEISNTTLPVGANQTQPSNTNINDYNYTPWGLAISATSFWILDFALNVIQSPVRVVAFESTAEPEILNILMHNHDLILTLLY
jgi:hypothetical protein